MSAAPAQAPALAVGALAAWLDGSAGVVRAVDGVDLDIAPGRTLALVGESGCGKSMTALALMRLLPPNGRIVGGAARIGATDVLALPEAEMRDVRGRRIAMIFQEPGTSLNPVLTVGDQVAEVLARHLGMTGAAARTRAIELFDAVGIPDPARRFEEYPFQLSGGMKQRVMIALALAAEPGVLIADEPTTALDVTIQAQVLALLRESQVRRGTAILLITHDLGIVAEMADEVAVMYAGEIVERAARGAFFRAPQHPYSRKLFESLPGGRNRAGTLAVISGQVPRLDADFRGCRFADRCDVAFERCSSEAPPWVGAVAGQGVRCWLRTDGRAAPPLAAAPPPSETVPLRSPVAEPNAAPLLSATELKVHFPVRRGLLRRTVGYVRAVDGVTLEVRAGRTLALVGESGCGKTTVGKALVQLVRPTAGAVHAGGVELTGLDRAGLHPHRRVMQIVFQDPYASLNPRMRIGDVLAEGMRSLGVGSSEADRAARARALLGRVGLPIDALGRYPHEFSGGQRQRVAIARALAVEPRVIVCDEPTSALDVSVQAQILNLLRELQRELGVGYLFITHNIAVVDYLADEVAVMYLGRIVERGTTDEVLRNPRHPYTQALLAAVPAIERGAQSERTPSAVIVKGEMPSPVAPPSGCHFHPRCPHASPACRVDYPATRSISATHRAACVLVS